MCDADVTSLAGVRAFDREMRDFTEARPRQKSNYTVWGANHNFYNTQWMVSDTFGVPVNLGGAGVAARFRFREQFPCTGGAGNTPLSTTGGPGSSSQRLTALSSVPALVRGNVGNGAVPADDTFNQNFNTLFRLPTTVLNDAAAPVSVAYPPAPPMRVDRGYSPTANCAVISVMEDFNQAKGTNTSGQANSSSGVTVQHLNGGGASEAIRILTRGDNAAFIGPRNPFVCCTGAAAGICTALRRPVIDRTGIDGLFNFALHWTPDGTEAQPLGAPNAAPVTHDPDAPSLFEALQEQLGLKLVSERSEIEMLVIDHIQATPTAN